MIKICLAAGGSGGHMFPAAALASELQIREVQVSLLTDSRGLAYATALQNVDTHQIPAAPLVGKGAWKKFRALWALLSGIGAARRRLRLLRPQVLVGFGGYVSPPPVIAAWSLGIPVLLHEQNAVMGLANRLASRFAHKIALSFLDTEAQPRPDRAVVTGNPVRSDFQNLAPYVGPANQAQITVFGGSQGAQVMATLVPAAILHLTREARGRIALTLQLRAEDQAQARNRLENCGLARLEIQTFLDPMAAYMARAHLLICRAGATTVAEVALASRPALFIPLALHRDAQQARNAAPMVAAGAARMVLESAASAESLAGEITTLINTPHLLPRMAQAAAETARPDAARDLADLALSLVQGPS